MKRVAFALLLSVLVCSHTQAQRLVRNATDGAGEVTTGMIRAGGGSNESAVPTEKRKVIAVDSVVVVARRTDEIVPAQVLSGERLESLSAGSIADAIRYFSGVQIKDYGGVGGLKTINVRSLGSAHVGVFYDGVAVGNAQNGVVDLGRFSLDNMGSVALYNGQKSDIFQSARDFASAAAVYLTSRKPVFEAGKTSNLRIAVKGGSFDLFDGSALWETRLGRRLSASANVEFLSTSGRYKYRYRKDGGYDTTAVRRNGDVRALRAEADFFGTLGMGEWRVKGYFYSSDRGYPGAAIKEDQAISLRNEDRQKDRNIFVQGSVRQQISNLYEYRIQAKYSHDYMNYVMPPESSLRPMDTHYRQSEFYFSSANLFTLTPWLSGNVSVDAQYNTLEADGEANFDVGFPHPRRLTMLGATAVSARLDRFCAQASLLYTYVHDESTRDGKAAVDSRMVPAPALVLFWRPFERANIETRAFYKQIFRLPTFNDLYYTEIGNRTLRPEFTTQYNVGVSWRGSRPEGFLAGWELSADAYYNEVKDKIVAVPTSNQLVWTMTNLGRVEIRGVDATIAPNLRVAGIKLDPRIAYTFQIARDSSSGDQVAYIPRHSGSATLGITIGRRRQWSLDYSFIYTGERWGLGGNIPANYIRPWYTHDLSASRHITMRRASLRITAEVNNIFNQQYEVVRWYPMPGTNFKIILSVTI